MGVNEGQIHPGSPLHAPSALRVTLWGSPFEGHLAAFPPRAQPSARTNWHCWCRDIGWNWSKNLLLLSVPSDGPLDHPHFHSSASRMAVFTNLYLRSLIMWLRKETWDSRCHWQQGYWSAELAGTVPSPTNPPLHDALHCITLQVRVSMLCVNGENFRIHDQTPYVS